MSQQLASHQVRLQTSVRNVPRGSVGVVRSVWFEPDALYEVEFSTPGEAFPTRLLLTDSQIEEVSEEVAHQVE